MVEQTEISYAEFPTHVTLREANEKYAANRKGVIPKRQDGTVLPFPGVRHKDQIFKPAKFADLDKYADEVRFALFSMIEFHIQWRAVPILQYVKRLAFEGQHVLSMGLGEYER